MVVPHDGVGALPAKLVSHALDCRGAARITREHAAVRKDLERRGSKRRRKRAFRGGPAARFGKRLVLQRLRENFERCGDDHTERSQRAVVQLHHVVAADVLHHAPAAGGQLAVRQRHANADQEIARRPVAQSQRTGPTGGEQPADGVARRVEGIHR